jgi:D-alanyl-D-alanine carboxypeptidase
MIDAESGKTLYAYRPDTIRYPASLTKLMTLYLTFDALDSGRLKLDQLLPVSAHAAAQPAIKLGLRAGERITVRQAIEGIVTVSANDAAVVLAEALGGSEPHFADMMNAEAHRLGLTDTVYRNATGLPNREQHTTAHDIAMLARDIWLNHHKYYHFFATREFAFDGHTFYSDNRLLRDFPGTDGMKTGFINASGFNLVASTKRDGYRLIGVVFGGTTIPARDRSMRAMLTQGFAIEEAGNAPRPEAAPTARLIAAVTPVPPAYAGTKASEQMPDHMADQTPDQTALVRALTPDASFSAAVPRPLAVPSLMPVAYRHIGAAARRGTHWAIQVGAFARPQQARRQAKRVLRVAPKLAARTHVQIWPLSHGHHRLYRVRLAGLSEREASTACRYLQQQNIGCLMLAP